MKYFYNISLFVIFLFLGSDYSYSVNVIISKDIPPYIEKEYFNAKPDYYLRDTLHDNDKYIQYNQQKISNIKKYLCGRCHDSKCKFIFDHINSPHKEEVLNNLSIIISSQSEECDRLLRIGTAYIGLRRAILVHHYCVCTLMELESYFTNLSIKDK